MPLPPELTGLGRRPLLVMSDYDGTLAPIAPRPPEAYPEPGARAALARLLHHPYHRVAVVTGRRIVQAQAFLNLPDLTVVGLHGMEWPDAPPPPAKRAAIAALARQMPTVHGFRLEDKTYTLAVHYRNVNPEERAGVEARLDRVILPPGWEAVNGKLVREYRPGGFGKGRAVAQLARDNPGHLPVFIGDDATDEEGFAAMLELGGVAVKVGEGATLAPHRLDSPAEVVALLCAWGEAAIR